MLGQPCSAKWSMSAPPAGEDQARWLWAETMRSTPIAEGEFWPISGGVRKFRILCDQEVAVVHPDDAGWLVRAVEPFMHTVKPIWAHGDPTTWLGDMRVPTGVFPWLPGTWICPECWPKIDMSGECSSCTMDSSKYRGADANLRQRYGYDPRAMMPWASNILDVPSCGKGGPGGPDTLCMPLYGTCWNAGQTASTYTAAFWQDVGQAVAAYNRESILAQYFAQGGGFMGLRGVGATAAAGEVAAAPPPKINWYPLLAIGLGAGIFSVFLARR